MVHSVAYNAATPPLAVLGLCTIPSLQGKVRLSSESKEPFPSVTDGKQTLAGEAAVLRVLAQHSDRTAGTNLTGSTPMEAAEVEAFLHLAFVEMTSKETLPEYARRLNEHLATRVYLVGRDLTIADLAVWSSLMGNRRWPSLQKQKDFQALLRWFNLINQRPELTAPRELLEKQRQQQLAKGTSGSYDIGLPGAGAGTVCTRFPPEPSGYLHIGHAKAALLNHFLARQFKGKLILRFDDTNPSKEKMEFVDNILEDLKTLGIDYDVRTNTSDYFEELLKFGDKILRAGRAYIDNTPVDQMRQERGAGIESKCRNHSLEENLRLWREMQAGSEEGLKCVMRAKIDMQSLNKVMRDPALYRCNLTPHPHTGTKYKVYPTYDFACPIVDSIEGVTHALRSSEYHDRNPLYYWVCDAVELRRPHIEDFSRLNLMYTVLSKRKLQWFVDEGIAEGWNDPRFPTIQGVMRRGMTVQGLREFIQSQGASKALNLMSWDKLWAVNRQVIDPIAPRYNAIRADTRVLVKLTNGPQTPEHAFVDLHPKNKSAGRKLVIRSGLILIEQEDAALIQPNEEVTLMAWGNAIFRKIERKGDAIVYAEAELNLKGDVSATSKKLTWVGVADPASPYAQPADGKTGLSGAAGDEDLVPCQLVEFDHLITKKALEEDDDIKDFLTPQTRFETPALGEPGLRTLQKGAIIQLQRRGFFIVDQIYQSPAKPLVLFYIPDGKQSGMSNLSSKVKAKSA